MAGASIGTSLDRVIGQLLMFFVILLLIPNAARSSETVESLSYRTTLFYYLQQDYFNALTELMLAQRRELSGSLSDGAELLRGGASLSYGMELEAWQIFEKLSAEQGATRDRDLAWFYLGKLAWQRGELDISAEALEKMSPFYLSELQAEANFLQASISQRQGDELLATTYDTLLPVESLWLYYLYFNLGASHAVRRDWSGAVDYFERVVQSPLSTPEMKSLRDKALTESGYALLAAGKYEQAAVKFSQVRLDSPVVDRALLGFGWAYSGMGDYRSAVTPWQTLTEHSLMSDSVREGLLALAYAHEKLGRWRTALKLYRYASEVYSTQMHEARAAIELFREADISQQFDMAGLSSQNWLSAENIFPQGEYLTYLHKLMSKHSFQLAMRELRDLHNIILFLSEADKRLRVLSQDKERADYASRIFVLQERVHSQQQQVNTKIFETQSRVRELAIGELEQQTLRLQQALQSSRLALVRLYEMGGPQQVAQ